MNHTSSHQLTSRKQTAVALTGAALMALIPLPALSADGGGLLPDPDGKPADMTKPVKVFIVMGQSNTLEMGKVKGGEGSLENAVQEKGRYPFLVDDDGAWTTRQDVRNVSVMQKKGNTNLYRNEWLTVEGKYPEFKRNVATVYTHPLSMGSSSNAHYGGNAETYMNVGEAMGRAMVDLFKNH